MSDQSLYPILRGIPLPARRRKPMPPMGNPANWRARRTLRALAVGECFDLPLADFPNIKYVSQLVSRGAQLAAEVLGPDHFTVEGGDTTVRIWRAA